MSNPYWRGMVKDAIGCTDEYADILLEYQYKVSNGIDTSEASNEELDKYWKWIDQEYQENNKIIDNRTREEMLEEIVDLTLELQDITNERFAFIINKSNETILGATALKQIIQSIKEMKIGE